MSEIRLYGIRHHGAGSARNLVSALDSFDPDIVLIEGPADTAQLIPFVQPHLLEPPVAILVYAQDNLQEHAYYPFTSFSPEWRAMHWAHDRQRQIRFIDLPHGKSLHLNDRTRRKNKGDNLVYDPFRYLAEIAGYQDAERWWDDYIEQAHDHEVVFETIQDLMIQLRSSASHALRTNQVREAYMRTQIRAAVQDGHKRIAIVCGAWHVPALYDHTRFKIGADNKLWKSIKSSKTKAAWVPWSYQRIALHSGYGAGVVSPFWYEALFEDPERAIAIWMSRAAAEMRKLGWNTSSADAIEAGRLVNALAALRGKNRPGVHELFDAMTTVYCQGNDEILERLEKKLLEGEKVGSVSEEVTVVPLQQDIEREIKACRLSKAWKTQEEIDKHFDLRKPTQLRASRLLHRMNLLGIAWGQEYDADNNPIGQFHEYWTLEWYPEFQIQIIEASLHGLTLREACGGFVKMHLSNQQSDTAQAAEILLKVLKADLPELIDPLCQSLKDNLTTSADLLQLLEVLPSLVVAYRYGSTQKLDVLALGGLLKQILPRICISLPNYVSGIKEDVAEQMCPILVAIDQALRLLTLESFQDQWVTALQEILRREQAQAGIKGFAIRALFDRNVTDIAETTHTLTYELSNKADPLHGLHFLENFLRGGGNLLIHHRSLRHAVDRWLLAMSNDSFLDYLAILRRVFSGFSRNEKENLFQLLTTTRKRDEEDVLISEPRKELILVGVRKLFS